jgi:hypothetical protein
MQINKGYSTHKLNQGEKSHYLRKRIRERFWQHSTAFSDKSSEENRNRRNIPQQHRNIDKPIANIIMGKTETISSKTRNKTRVSTLPTPVQYSTWISSQTNNIGKKLKGIQMKKKSSSVYLLILCSYTWNNLKTPPRHYRCCKYIQQGNRIQNQCTKYQSISIHKKWTVWEDIRKSNIHNSIKKFK